MTPQNRFSLYELNSLVRQAVDTLLPDEYWVEAELSEVRERSGHCYLELVQKDTAGNTPVARASAKCWRQTWMAVKPYFERITGQVLHSGMKVLLKVYAQFHEAYGFSWIVTDIDPSFTLGDMARKRQEIIARLKADGVLDLNKTLPMPAFAQRIAVISSATAAGYGDFCRQLADNGYGFAFTTQLFTAKMQGEEVEQSIIGALNRINAQADRFDCVAIIRGGGATSDLSGFDSLALAENVANFPLPVITGIGHDRDESVIDMVSHTRVKTPTAAAVFLIDHLLAVAGRLEQGWQAVLRLAKRRMETERMRLEQTDKHLPTLFAVVKTRQEAKLYRLTARLNRAAGLAADHRRHRIDLLEASIREQAVRSITRETHRLDLLEQRCQWLDPQRLLNRGYSITLLNGKAVYDAQTLKPGDTIVTRLAQGCATSTILSTDKQHDE